MKFYRYIILLFFSLISIVSHAGEGKDIIAVHNFNVSSSLQTLKISGWWISEIMENELVQAGKCRVVTRARISRVMKEKNISSSSTITPQSLGKIIGAHFIVTGQAEYSGGKLIVTANMIDASRQTGEITESYEISENTEDEDVAAKLSQIVEKLAILLTMTPGDFLDQGLAKMKEGNYIGAVEIFQYFEREAKLEKILELIDMVDRKNLSGKTTVTDISTKTPGEVLDYGITLMQQGKSEDAALVFYQLQQSRMAKKINNLMDLAKTGAKKQNEKINQKIISAKTKFTNAINNEKKAELNKDPVTLCDEAITELRGFLSDPKTFVSKSKRLEVDKLITTIEQFRKKLFAGPATDSKWLIPQIKIPLIPIKAGELKMSNALPVEEREEPEYTVVISKPFWMGKTEITAGEFLYYLKSLKFNSKSDQYEIDREIDFDSNYCPINKQYRLKRNFTNDHPMCEISWRAANNFIKWINTIESEADRLPEGYEYRLPTEAEWEYSCRAGTDTAFSFGDNTEHLKDYAWFRSNSNRQAQKKGLKKPNKWGLYDMHGNVWEWCNDWYGEQFLVADAEDPIGPADSNDNSKVLRGGSYTSSPLDLRCGSRYSSDYKRGRKNVGFRIVCAPEL